MADKVIGWESQGDEPEIPGSPHVPTEAEKAEAKAKREAEAKAKREAEEAAMRKRMAADEAGMKANMARMGNFKVPGPVPRRAPERAAAKERGVLAHRDGVHIRNAVEAVIFAAVLKRLPVFDSSEVVAYRKVAAWLNGGKYSLFIF
jgi:hypothetical protein